MRFSRLAAHDSSHTRFTTNGPTLTSPWQAQTNYSYVRVQRNASKDACFLTPPLADFISRTCCRFTGSDLYRWSAGCTKIRFLCSSFSVRSKHLQDGCQIASFDALTGNMTVVWNSPSGAGLSMYTGLVITNNAAGDALLFPVYGDSGWTMVAISTAGQVLWSAPSISA